MIIVEDNLVSQELQDYYHMLVFGSVNVNAMLPLVCKYEPTAFEGDSIPISFEHVFKSSTKLTEHYGNFSKIPQVVCSKLNINFIDIIAARLFITVPHKTKLEYYAPHTDRPEEHLGLIYYVNDSDGDTVFFKNKEIITGIMNFEFMGGSMGRAVGGAIVKGAKIAIEEKLPYVIVTSSGGARMQEGIVSLMQMPRTIAAVDLLDENKIPYIVILTEPTTGGVTASFAMLGDITIAEQGATIGFAGKRVIQDTIREELPIDFQKAEYLKDHGMVDIVSHRKDLKETLYKVIDHIN